MKWNNNSKCEYLEYEEICNRCRLFHTLEEGIIILGKSGEIAFWNPGAERFFGLSASDVVGKRLWELGLRILRDDGQEFSPDDLSAALTLRNGEQFRNHVLGLANDRASVTWFSVNTQSAHGRDDGRLVGAIMTVHDISKFGNTESSRSARYFRAMLENVWLIGLMLDRDGSIMYCNDYLLSLTGWKREEVFGKNWFDIFIPDDIREEISNLFYTAIATGHIPKHRENAILTRTGERRLILWNNISLRDSDGRVSGTASLGADITAMRASERRFRTLFKHSPVPTWVEDLSEVKRYLSQLAAEGVSDFATYFKEHPEETQKCALLMKVVETNEANSKFLQVDSKEDLLANLPRMLYDASWPALAGKWAALACGASVYEFELPLRDKQGTSKIAEVRLSVDPEATETLSRVLVSFFDITERKTAEQALSQKTRELEGIMELVDLATIFIRDSEGRIVHWNKGCEALYGFTREEALGRHAPELLQTRFPEPTEKIRQILETTGRWEGELSQTRKDGKRIVVASVWVLHTDGADQPLALLEVNNDISKMKEIESALRESEERLRVSQEVARIGTFEWDMKSGVHRWSAQMEALYGLPRGGFFGTLEAWKNMIHPADLPEVEHRLERAMEKGDFEGEWRVRCPDESMRWIAARGWVYKDQTGRPSRLLGVNIDITDRKQMEQELKSAKSSAEAGNAAKDRFLAVLSHELRTPLTPVLAAVSILQKQPTTDKKTQVILEMARRNVELEAQLIDDLLDLTRIARGKVELDKQRMDLRTIIRRAVDVCREDLEARELDLHMDLGASPLIIDGDSARLQQVFWNLLKNAIKFTPHGGSLTIRCRIDEAEQVIAEVIDTGVGIEREALSRIFDAFEQAERSITRQFGGLGLGLAISKSLVELHGGTIEALSEGKDKGATFRLHLPLVTVGGKAVRDDSFLAPSHEMTSPLHLLMVEDNGDTAALIRLLLEAEGHRVETAGDVASALDLAAREHFDVLLSDLGLPDATGYDLMRELRARGISMPGIALSGYGREQDIEQSYDAGFKAHILKPVKAEQLLAALERVTHH